MNSAEVEDAPKSSQETGFGFSTQHERVLDTALTPEANGDIFRWVAHGTQTPLLCQIGSSGGGSTAQIAQRLREEEIEDERLIA